MFHLFSTCFLLVQAWYLTWVTLKLVLYSHIRNSAFNNFADLHVKRLLSSIIITTVISTNYNTFSVELGRFKEADKHAYLYAV